MPAHDAVQTAVDQRLVDHAVGVVPLVHTERVELRIEGVRTGAVTELVHVHDELVPMLTIGLSVIGAVFAALMPLLKNVSLGADKFSSAAKAIEKVSNDNEKNVRKISDLENRLENIERASKNTEEIVRIGFGNLKELVVKGHAREIAKVGKEEEISNEETN